jgi:hypothetical protein
LQFVQGASTAAASGLQAGRQLSGDGAPAGDDAALSQGKAPLQHSNQLQPHHNEMWQPSGALLSSQDGLAEGGFSDGGAPLPGQRGFSQDLMAWGADAGYVHGGPHRPPHPRHLQRGRRGAGGRHAAWRGTSGQALGPLTHQLEHYPDSTGSSVAGPVPVGAGEQPGGPGGAPGGQLPSPRGALIRPNKWVRQDAAAAATGTDSAPPAAAAESAEQQLEAQRRQKVSSDH